MKLIAMKNWKKFSILSVELNQYTHKRFQRYNFAI